MDGWMSFQLAVLSFASVTEGYGLDIGIQR